MHVLSEKGSEAAHYLWCADEMDTGDKSLWAKIENGLIIESCRMWYRLRYADPDDGMTQQEALRPFREMLQRACGRLNLLDWKGIAAVTEDFVVFPADWSHMFCDDYGDMLASVPAAKIEVLRRRSVIEI